jgi:hypothetical protein
MGDKLDSRRVLIMPTSAEGLRGQQRDAAVKNEALVLADAIVSALDVIDLFEHQGGLVLVANGEVRNVNSELLRWLIEASFVQKHVVRKLPGLGHEVELRPVNSNEMSIRAMLTKEPREGGLIGRLPVLQIEMPQLEVAAPQKQPLIVETAPAEHAAGRAAVARHANSDERRRLEIERGAQVVERYRQGRQAAVEPSTRAQEPVEESYPIRFAADGGDATAQETKDVAD